MRGVDAVLDRRLQPAHPRPLAVALSGGGDSLALTLVAHDWARANGRELVVLTVDHGLQPESRAWVEACRATAGRLARPFRALAWEGEKPATGLPAAARAARHRLLADAAREAGAEVILMGHTADDVAEAQAMRTAGSTTPTPREWAPSPAWPAGRGVFVLRPLLGVRRAELRDLLARRSENWIEDPANLDPRYARSRARASAPPPATPAEPDPLAEAADVEEIAGALQVPRSADSRLLAIAAVCAGGGDRRPAAPRLERLVTALRGGEAFTASLAGARVTADRVHALFAREPGEAARGGLATLSLVAGQPMVWDGRFEVTATSLGMEVRRLAGLAARLPGPQRRALQALPAAVRGGLPAVVQGERIDCPLLAPLEGVAVRSLVGERLRAASGLVDRERP